MVGYTYVSCIFNSLLELLRLELFRLSACVLILCVCVPAFGRPPYSKSSFMAVWLVFPFRLCSVAGCSVLSVLSVLSALSVLLSGVNPSG